MKELYRINIIDAGDSIPYYVSDKKLFKFAKSLEYTDDITVSEIDPESTETDFANYIYTKRETYEFPFIILGETDIIVD